MRPSHALLGALLAFVGLCCNKSIDATTGNSEEAGPDRVVKIRPGSKVKVGKAPYDANYDFGTMEVGQTGKHTFKITSVGEEPLEIKQGETTCKCTIAGISAGGKKVGKDKTLVLKKGESASIDLEWTPKSNQPMFQQTAVIHTSDPEQPQVRLMVTGQIKALITLQPSEFWTVGAIDGDKPVTFPNFSIGSAILEKFSIEPITCPDERIKAEAKPLSKDELTAAGFKSGYRITVTVLPKDAIGKFEENLTIKTDARDGLTFTPRVVGVRTGPVLIREQATSSGQKRWFAESMHVSLRRFPASEGNSVELLLYVAGLGDEELKITKVEKKCDLLKVALHKQVDKDAKSGKKTAVPLAGRRKIYRLVFSVPPGQEPSVRTGSQAVKVKLHTNHKRMKTISLTVSFNSF